MAEGSSIIVTGATGQLGRSLRLIAPEHSNYRFTFLDRSDLDLSRAGAITHYFQSKRFDIIINCAAYTLVDKAEKESEAADNINHVAVKTLAEIAKSQDTVLIHISTDYVYDFAKAIFDLSGVDCTLNAIETKDYPTPALRPGIVC